MPTDRCVAQLCRMRCLMALMLAAVATFLSIIVVGMTTSIHQGIRSGLFVVDTDAGTDDAMALLLLLEVERRHRELPEGGPRVLAITAVNGNTNVDNVCRNVLKVLSVADRLDIPVYRGASKSLKSTPPTTNFFGVDGMGDVPCDNPPPISLLQEDHAVLGLIKLVNENPGQINLLMMGPLTNLALAIRLDEKFLDKVKHVFILGGAANGRGNVAPGVEFNFRMDPEANYAVLSDTDYSNETITLMPLEPSLNMKITQRWRNKTLGSISSASIDFLNKIEHISTTPLTNEMWVFPDPLLVAATLKPELITRTDFHAVVTLTQGETRGGIAVDFYDSLKTRPKLTIIQELDEEAYKNFLLSYLSSYRDSKKKKK